MTARFAWLLALPLVASLAITAHADAYEPVQEEPTPQPPPTAQPPVLYPAPLTQTTQTTYVPQSIALSGPDEIDAEEGRRAPVGYTPVERTRKGMLIGGGITLGVAYFYSALVASLGDDLSSDSFDDNGRGGNEFAAMWVPVAGPFLQMVNTDSSSGKLLLGMMGGAQVVGAVLLYKGLATTKTVYVRNDLVSNLSIAPMVGGGNAGMAVAGRF